MRIEGQRRIQRGVDGVARGVHEERRAIGACACHDLRGKRVFLMAPLHHHFELKGWKESKVIIRFWIASLIFALFALTTLKLR